MGPFGYSPYQWQQPTYQQPQKGISFIKNLFKKNNYQSYYQPNPFFQSPVPYEPTSSTSLVDTLAKVQKGLGIIQQATPYIKEYGPLVKNLPMFFDMMKIMMENDEENQSEQNEEGSKQDENVSVSDEGKDENSNTTSIQTVNNRSKGKKMNVKKTNELPKPKLYI
ncbi:VrrA/YqfQ family protein [Bacillaceae bacterium W0354]